MTMFQFNQIPDIAICIAGIIVGILALRRHKTAAWLTIVGWGLLLTIQAGLLLTIHSILGFSITQILFVAFDLASHICIFLGIYLLVKKTTSQKPFFSLKYEGLDLRPDTERDS